MFGFSDAVEGSQKTLEIINNEISVITILWDHIDGTQKVLSGYQDLKWKEIITDNMEDEIKVSKKGLTSKIKG